LESRLQPVERDNRLKAGLRTCADGAPAIFQTGWYGFMGTESLTIRGLPSSFTGPGYRVVLHGDSNESSRIMNDRFEFHIESPP
jgi:hypothetical protein